MSKEGNEARGLVVMGLEVGWDTEDDGTLACGAVLELVRGIDIDTGLLEVLASLQWAAESAADVHEGIGDDEDMPETVARLKRFAAHIAAARKEIL